MGVCVCVCPSVYSGEALDNIVKSKIRSMYLVSMYLVACILHYLFKYLVSALCMFRLCVC